MKIARGDVAVITGGASGIGLAIAQSLAARGVALALADVEEPALREAVAQLRGDGADVEGWPLDVLEPSALAAMATEVEARFGRVDLLVCSAGVGGVAGPSWQLDPKDWAWVIGVNALGVANTIAAFVPGLVARGRGHVLTVASAAGLATPPFSAPYAASKHAVVGMTEALAQELAIVASPVRASVLCPGLVESRIFQSGRNRPAAFAAESRVDPSVRARIEAGMAAANGAPMAGERLAALALAGVEADRLHILTHPALVPGIGARLRRIEDACRDAGEAA